MVGKQPDVRLSIYRPAGSPTGKGRAFQSRPLFGFAIELGSDTILTFSSGNALTLHNVTLGSLVADDFLFYEVRPRSVDELEAD